MKNKQAALGWKRRFAQDLFDIRRRVIADKLRAAQAETLAPRTVADSVRRRRSKKVNLHDKPKALPRQRSKHSTNAPYATALRNWWATQKQFRRQQDFSAKVGVNPKAVSDWLASKKFPRSSVVCDELHRITELECFSPEGRRLARREHRKKKGETMNGEQLVCWAESFRGLIERVGAELVAVKNGEILFRADANSPVCSLYPFACNEENIKLALKSAAEEKRAGMWELESVAKPNS